ncbi:hypothetical protein [Mucilaginibacter sp. OK098]|uniref:hypothetical protein n=1 Tax=Mucilaginibacter sp. OK098 TaxID=1855297 RepID=UPI00092290AB|nr:hypothetical protein [Mucilaginibacter sp. OK098]SHN30847.1 hypothetical protein SAMN05216524_10982 [Mucilaginibacter sp. OK098]
MNGDYIYAVYLTLLLLVTIAGLIRYKKLSKAFKILTVLILCTLISESIKKVYGKIYHNNMPVAHIWAVIEYAFFSLTYFYLLTNKLVKKAIIVSIIAMLILEIVNVLFFEKITQFPSLILEASHIVYVVYSLLLFRQMLLFPAEQSLFKQSLFWFNINVLFYATTMFLDFALLSYFIQNKLDVIPLAYFALAVNFIFYIVIGISILMDNKKENITEFING